MGWVLAGLTPGLPCPWPACWFRSAPQCAPPPAAANGGLAGEVTWRAAAVADDIAAAGSYSSTRVALALTQLAGAAAEAAGGGTACRSKLNLKADHDRAAAVRDGEASRFSGSHEAAWLNSMWRFLSAMAARVMQQVSHPRQQWALQTALLSAAGGCSSEQHRR
jgi:hypothetical protein